MIPNGFEELEDQLQDETVELTNEEISERFKIDNLESLDWAFRKVAAYRNEFSEQEALVDKNIENLKAEIKKHVDWLEGERVKTERNVGFFEHLIAEYHTNVLAENPKKKSISTPNGKVQSTTRKPSILKPEDKSLPQLIEYAEQNAFNQFIEIKKDLNWSYFKKELQVKEVNGQHVVVDSNGQIVPEVPINEGGTTFKITT